VGKTGDVENLKVVLGPRELQQSSLDAVRQWKYKPYLVNGDPVDVKTTISVVYSLQK
jgi:outer membrane biosynthesis protein TonB